MSKLPELPLPQGFVLESLITVDYNDFDGLVETVLGVPYEFVSAYEADNDSDYEFDMTEIDEYDEVEIMKEVELTKARIKNKKESWDRYSLDNVDIHVMFSYLIDKGHLPKAKYLIKVSW